MANKPYIIWLGAVFDEPTIINKPAVSLAANRWQQGLLQAITATGTAVVTLGHTPEPAWPKARLFVSQQYGTLAAGSDGSLVSYLNLPTVRDGWLRWQYAKHLRGLFDAHGLPIAVLSYNASPF